MLMLLLVLLSDWMSNPLEEGTTMATISSILSFELQDGRSGVDSDHL